MHNFVIVTEFIKPCTNILAIFSFIFMQILHGLLVFCIILKNFTACLYSFGFSKEGYTEGFHYIIFKSRTTSCKLIYSCDNVIVKIFFYPNQCEFL